MPRDERIVWEWDTLVPLLFASKNITSGLWHVGLKLQFAGTTAGPSAEEAVPAGIVGVMGVFINEAKGPGPMVYDASTGHATFGSSKSSKSSKRAKPAGSKARAKE